MRRGERFAVDRHIHGGLSPSQRFRFVGTNTGRSIRSRNALQGKTVDQNHAGIGGIVPAWEQFSLDDLVDGVVICSSERVYHLGRQFSLGKDLKVKDISLVSLPPPEGRPKDAIGREDARRLEGLALAKSSTTISSGSPTRESTTWMLSATRSLHIAERGLAEMAGLACHPMKKTYSHTGAGTLSSYRISMGWSGRPRCINASLLCRQLDNEERTSLDEQNSIKLRLTCSSKQKNPEITWFSEHLGELLQCACHEHAGCPRKLETWDSRSNS